MSECVYVCVYVSVYVCVCVCIHALLVCMYLDLCHVSKGTQMVI